MFSVQTLGKPAFLILTFYDKSFDKKMIVSFLLFALRIQLVLCDCSFYSTSLLNAGWTSKSATYCNSKKSRKTSPNHCSWHRTCFIVSSFINQPFTTVLKWIRLPRKRDAKEYNLRRLEALPGDQHSFFSMDYAGWDVYREKVSGMEAKETLNSTTLAPKDLVLKVSI